MLTVAIIFTVFIGYLLIASIVEHILDRRTIRRRCDRYATRRDNR